MRKIVKLLEKKYDIKRIENHFFIKEKDSDYYSHYNTSMFFVFIRNNSNIKTLDKLNEVANSIPIVYNGIQDSNLEKFIKDNYHLKKNKKGYINLHDINTYEDYTYMFKRNTLSAYSKREKKEVDMTYFKYPELWYGMRYIRDLYRIYGEF